ncbi:efflux RND transporter permease subunit [Inquilinus sp. CA228]|uniref:efflux RND transporter permease subunit n=1 Tax=Inquilinus sp. CA228 TaxID=3455609 RepID=UPI003F8D3371
MGFGSGVRRPLGVAIVGGLIVSQVLTLWTTSVLYLVLKRFRRWARGRWARAWRDLAPGAAE